MNLDAINAYGPATLAADLAAEEREVADGSFTEAMLAAGAAGDPPTATVLLDRLRRALLTDDLDDAYQAADRLAKVTAKPGADAPAGMTAPQAAWTAVRVMKACRTLAEIGAALDGRGAAT